MKNRLADAPSPYLRQHASNPVAWQEWTDEAFALARELDRPVFLSVGYATCHWCHVMAHESFEDDEVAALLNEHFVPIKLDREERPDVDALYMTFCQAVTGHGGWPLTVLLTPEREPFYVGTYYPKQGRGNRPGLMQLLPAIGKAWRQDRASVVASAERLTGQLRDAFESTPEPSAAPDERVLDAAFNGLAARFDGEWGGFGTAPKFPTPSNLLFLLREHRRTGDERALHPVALTLTRMRLGGLWDHLGGGFHRYATDRLWKLPHFEKMLYDQALLVIAYAEAHQVTGSPLFRETVEQTIAYVTRDLMREDGLFFSAEDADSETPDGHMEEGAFYTWTYDALIETLGPEDGPLAVGLFNASREGNFEDEATGRKTGQNVLFRTRTPEQAAEALEMSEDELAEREARLRDVLFAARAPRPRPLLDDKVLTDWNGLMIAALATAARALGHDDYAETAARAADALLARMKTDDGRLLHRLHGDDAGIAGLADDYAFLAWGLVELHQATFEPRWLAEAVTLAETLLERFADAESGGLFGTPDDGETLLFRQRPYHDGATPSANSVAAFVLVRLARLTGNTDLEERAAAILASNPELARFPAGHTMAAVALGLLEGRSREIVVAGDPEADDTRALLAVVREAFRPEAVVHLRPPDGTAEADALIDLAPYLGAQPPQNGRATAYVCTDFACRAPAHSPDALRDQLADAS